MTEDRQIMGMSPVLRASKPFKYPIATPCSGSPSPTAVGRADLRVLGDRQRQQRDAAGQGYDDRHDRGDDWPIDEKAREA
jgi:hypothetical protein